MQGRMPQKQERRPVSSRPRNLHPLHGAQKGMSVETQIELLESALERFKPVLSTKTSPWRHPEEISYALALAGNPPVLRCLLAYLNTSDERHDGGTTYRRCTYVAGEKAFVCDTASKPLPNVRGFMVLEPGA